MISTSCNLQNLHRLREHHSLWIAEQSILEGYRDFRGCAKLAPTHPAGPSWEQVPHIVLCSKLIRLWVHPNSSRLDLGCASCVAQTYQGDGNS